MTISRRGFMAGAAAGFAGCLGLSAVGHGPWQKAPRVKDGVETINSARNLIFVLLSGAPSHIDTFDLKLGPWTPDELGAESFGGGFRWPSGYMPKLGAMTDRFSLVRSLTALEQVHERAIYQVTTAHRLNVARVGEIPHFGSLLSYKLKESRRPEDSLPSVMMISNNQAKNGFLPVEHLGISLGDEASMPILNHDFQGADQRFQLLDNMLGAKAHSGKQQDQMTFHQQARTMMNDEDLKNLIPRDVGNFGTFGGQAFRRHCEVAVEVLSANKGTRIFQLEMGGWDHHQGIYLPNEFGLPGLARRFDDGFSYLIEELSSRPGQDGSGTLLDETLVVAMGEFGRTVGNLNTSGGRDHYPYVVPAILAGGGVKGGRQIGLTDATGGAIINTGWSHNRYMSVNDLVATMYSCLGIDPSEPFFDTPSGRRFELIDSNLAGPAHAIDDLFV